jgi:DNA-binding NtrC family response regulator
MGMIRQWPAVVVDQIAAVEVVERQDILETLEPIGGDREEASRLLGIGERTLYRKLGEYRIG